MSRKTELLHRCELLHKKEVAPSIFCLTLRWSLKVPAEPGQFVHVNPGPKGRLLLRRPVSIHDIDVENKTMCLLIQIAGRGTALITGFSPGKTLDLIGPLGKGFPCASEKRKPLLLAGGIGLAPLYFLARRRQRDKLPFELILGGRSANLLPGEDYFQQGGISPDVVTEDGSRGRRGLATDLLAGKLKQGEPVSRIHACGPLPMLARAVELGRAFQVPVHVSLEERMACGVGACLGCVFPCKGEEGIIYRRVCADGPVFNGEEVYFEYD